MNPFLIRMAITIGVVAVSGIAAMFYYNRQQSLTGCMKESRPCNFCMKSVPDQEVRILDCGHIYHERCIQTWVRRNSTCPRCDKPIRS